jgi:hypothetical protein
LKVVLETIGNIDVVFKAGHIPYLYSKVILYGDYNYKQEVDYVENDSFPADSHENVVDKLTYLHLKNKEIWARCIKVAIDQEDVDITFPSPSASKLIGWDDDATNLINYENPAVEAQEWADLAHQYAVEGGGYVSSSSENASIAQSAATTTSGYLVDIDTAISNSTATAGQLTLTNTISI